MSEIFWSAIFPIIVGVSIILTYLVMAVLLRHIHRPYHSTANTGRNLRENASGDSETADVPDTECLEKIIDGAFENEYDYTKCSLEMTVGSTDNHYVYIVKGYADMMRTVRVLNRKTDFQYNDYIRIRGYYRTASGGVPVYRLTEKIADIHRILVHADEWFRMYDQDLNLVYESDGGQELYTIKEDNAKTYPDSTPTHPMIFIVPDISDNTTTSRVGNLRGRAVGTYDGKSMETYEFRILGLGLLKLE